MLCVSTTLLLAASCLLALTGVSAEMATTCGNNIHHLGCDSGVISVRSVLYGRADTVTCSGMKSAAELAKTDCSLNNADQIVMKRCNGKTVCELNSNIFESDPCSDTSKYLQTNYTCLPAIRFVACEHSLAHLHCEDGQVILVHGADFGRRDRTTCSYRKLAAQVENTDCSQPTSVVADRCNGKTSCTMRASTAVFGEPCANIYKYLEVAYSCLYPDN